MITLERYVLQRLGPGSGPRMALNMFSRAFTATSLRAFWQYWNPGYGFLLCRYCYRPLRRFLPHSVSLLLTFAACGFFLHDVLYLIPMAIQGAEMPLPFVSCWFLFLGAFILLFEFLGINFSRLGAAQRVVIHAGMLGATCGLTVLFSAQV